MLFGRKGDPVQEDIEHKEAVDSWDEGGGPAFPTNADDVDGTVVLYRGLSVRDYFAGMALQGSMLIAIQRDIPKEDVAAECYAMADAMLKQRAMADE
jgi:hypothetical protein